MSSPIPSHALSPGSSAPDFALADARDGTVTLSQLRGQPVILAFSPPGWNPERTEQMALFNEIVEKAQPHGARLIGLEVEGIWCDLDFADREKLRFPLLRDFDPEGAVARAYGVYGERALFVIDETGTIRWSQVVPTGVPPRSDEVIDALRALNAGNEARATSSSSLIPRPPSLTMSRREFAATTLAAAFALAVAPLAARAQSFSNLPADGVLPNGTSVSGPDTRAANMAGGATVPVALQVNGALHRLTIEPRTSLLDALRENIGLIGTKKGCNQGACGACTVLVNGQRINSCLTLAIMHEGEAITTVEGLARGEELHPVQAAFIEYDGFQCGYCTSGQVVSAVACIKEGHTGSEAEIREWMSGNICRCGAYPNIVAAVQAAAGKKPQIQDIQDVLHGNATAKAQGGSA